LHAVTAKAEEEIAVPICARDLHDDRRGGGRRIRLTTAGRRSTHPQVGVIGDRERPIAQAPGTLGKITFCIGLHAPRDVVRARLLAEDLRVLPPQFGHGHAFELAYQLSDIHQADSDRER